MRMWKQIIDLCVDALITDGAHHKQWYLEKILNLILEEGESALTVEEYKIKNDLDWEEGIPP